MSNLRNSNGPYHLKLDYGGSGYCRRFVIILSLDSQYPSESYTSLDRHGLTLHIIILI